MVGVDSISTRIRTPRTDLVSACETTNSSVGETLAVSREPTPRTTLTAAHTPTKEILRRHRMTHQAYGVLRSVILRNHECDDEGSHKMYAQTHPTVTARSLREVRTTVQTNVQFSILIVNLHDSLSLLPRDHKKHAIFTIIVDV